jgi:hypothetical protein
VDVRVTTPAGTSAVSAADEWTNTFSSQGYAVSVAASSTAPAVGGSVTVTATANQDMGPTPYGISVVDAATNQVLGHVGSGTSLSVSVSSASATSHRYVGRIDSQSTAPGVAVSAPVVVTWA